VTRPRAADDFPAIRARLKELRRERGDMPVEDDTRMPDGPRPYAAGSRARPANSMGLSPIMRRALQRVRTA
jgi:hypothetical protein